MSIVAQKITYIHPDNQVLFKGIDLTINKGQKVALVGNNGSGKSTFLRILAGTLQAQEGEIIYPTPPYYVPQHFGQYDNLTVAQALRIDGKLEALRAITEGDASLSNFNTLADDWTIEERSLAALHAWGLEHILLSQPMRTLSGGEKTKVFLSGIEIHQPRSYYWMSRLTIWISVAGRSYTISSRLAVSPCWSSATIVPY